MQTNCCRGTERQKKHDFVTENTMKEKLMNKIHTDHFYMIKDIKKVTQIDFVFTCFMASVYIQTQRLSVHEKRKAETPTTL